MMQKVLIALVLVAAAVGGYLARQHLGQEPAPVMPGQSVALTLPDLEGNVRSLADWDGQARLVNFWATWCAPCRREIPLLKQVQAAHGDGRLQVIGVAVDRREDVVAYAETAEFNYPVLIGQDEAIAAAEDSGVPFIGLPFTMVISPEGDLIQTHMGEIVGEQIEKIVDVLGRLESGELDLAGARRELEPL
jgi:thiol-disulfide isomerase/thioredoxin